MLKVRRILRDYENAGSVNSLLALWGFVDNETFLTKAGYVGHLPLIDRERMSGVRRMRPSTSTSASRCGHTRTRPLRSRGS